MTREETTNIVRYLQANYSNFAPNPTDTVNAWAFTLQDEDYGAIKAAAVTYVRTDTKGFPPKVGQLLEIIEKLTKPEEANEMTAWGIVRKAIGNSSYHSAEEFAKLPEAIQKAVGSADQLRMMAIDEEFNESVASSNFMRSYRQVIAREAELRRLPPAMKQLISAMNGQIEEKA